MTTILKNTDIVGELLTLAKRQTPARIRMEAHGFYFMSIQVAYSLQHAGYLVQALIQPPSGVVKSLVFPVPEDPALWGSEVDPAKVWEAQGGSNGQQEVQAQPPTQV